MRSNSVFAIMLQKFCKICFTFINFKTLSNMNFKLWLVGDQTYFEILPQSAFAFGWSDWNESFLLWLVMASSQEMWSSLTLDTRPLRPASGLIHLYLSRALVLYRSLLSCSHRSISSSKPPSYSRWCRLFAAWFFLCRFVLILMLVLHVSEDQVIE